MLYEARVLGYNYPDVNRNKLETFIEGTVHGRRKVAELRHFKAYNDFFTVWNFIKHNSVELFEKVKERCPEMLLSDTYKNGQLSQYFLKIDDSYVDSVLNGLGLFFDENTEYSKWNYDDYFTGIIQKTINKKYNRGTYLWDICI